VIFFMARLKLRVIVVLGEDFFEEDNDIVNG
jgi:hypothetical protein